MATAYHLEALRRQRIIDRAAEARRRLQEQQLQKTIGNSEVPTEAPQKVATSQKTRKAKRKHHAGTKVKLHDKDSAPNAILETSEGHWPSTQADEESEVSRQHSKAGSRASSKSPPLKRAPSTAMKSQDCSSQTISDRPTSQNGSISRSSSGQSSRGTSRSSSASTATRTHSTDAQRTRTRPTTAELKVEAVRRDLARQEKVLHDSNLLMGTIDPKDEQYYDV